MSSLPSFYAQQMLNLHNEYGLSENAGRMLLTYDNWRAGHIDQDELGRIVRMSPSMRRAITETIAKCAGIMRMFLPHQSNTRNFGLVATPKKAKCIQVACGLTAWCSTCPGFRSPPHHSGRNIDISLGLASKRARNEFFTFLSKFAQLSFSCSCDLGYHMQTNQHLQLTARRIKVHLMGIEAHHAFHHLGNAPQLEELEIVLSQSTSVFPSVREMIMRRFFPAPPRLLRLTDSLGIDELLRIRGVKALAVTHVDPRQGDPRSEEDRASLLALL
ncbi:hypothetical protein B0H67DRAFT_463602, partial [Lasiosphaeris hirsuta]